MSKIICDVCGTSYPETATQCPICGCVRPGEPITVAGDTNEPEVSATSSYTYVKGGRFSKSNVKKRNNGRPIYNSESAHQTEEKKPTSKKAERGLIAAVIVLLLAIAAVVIYIACNLLGVELPFNNIGVADNPAGDKTHQGGTTETTLLEVPCEGLDVSDTVIEFDKIGAVYLLNVKVSPNNCTDVVLFESGDEEIVTVNEVGKVQAVGVGQTMISISCGDCLVQCRVVCTDEGSTETTEESVPEVTYSIEDFKLNRDDFSRATSDTPWVLYEGNIPTNLIEWKSEYPEIATFVDGVVTPIKAGTTKVYATYNGVTLECIVRVY